MDSTEPSRAAAPDGAANAPASGAANGPPGPGASGVVILGGGVAGLAAALRLAEGGHHRALVLEREDRPGGLAKCLNFKGVSSDMGPHRIHTELPEVERLVADVAAPALYTVQRRSRIHLAGKFLDYPPSPLEIMARLGPFASARFGASMALQKLTPAPAPEDETYESIMRRAFGPALYNFMLRPYTAKVWKTDPAEIHADTARVRVSAGSLAKMLLRIVRAERKGSETALKEFKYVRGGIETLVKLLLERARAAGAEVRSAAPVRRIELERVGGGAGAGDGGNEGRFRAARVIVGDGNKGAESVIPADAVISTAPITELVGSLLPAIPELEAARRAASGLVYLTVIFALVIVRRKVISGDNWLYFPDPSLVFNRAYESKSFDPEMGPADKSVLCVEITCRPGDALDRESDGALAREVVRQMAGTGLFAEREVEETLIYRLPFGYPLYSLDYDKRLDAIHAGLGRIENLMTCGRQGLFNHNNTDHSMLMGMRAAEALQKAGPSGAAREWAGMLEEFRHFRIVD